MSTISGSQTPEDISEFNLQTAKTLIENNSGIVPLIIFSDEFQSSNNNAPLFQQTQIVSTDPLSPLYESTINIADIVKKKRMIYVVMDDNQPITFAFNSTNYITIIQYGSENKTFTVNVVGTGTYDTFGLTSGTYTGLGIGEIDNNILPKGTSILLGSAYFSSDGLFNVLSSNPSENPAHGVMLSPGFIQDRTHTEFNIPRVQLRNAWNTHYKGQLKTVNKKAAIGGFRAVNNAGDLLSRKNYTCGGSNQLSKSKPGYKGLMGSIMNRCDNTGIPAANCNSKYVYDSSDYIRYKKQTAHSRNYNDIPGGGTSTLTPSFILGRVI